MADAPTDDGPNNGSLSPPTETLILVPVDKVAQLEKRVTEDPRGALDAWLALMAEHRCRGNIAQARETYERFLAIFPQAVCLLRPLPQQRNANNGIGRGLGAMAGDGTRNR